LRVLLQSDLQGPLGPGEITLVDTGPTHRGLVPGEEEPVPEPLGHLAELRQRRGDVAVVVLQHPAEGRQFLAVGQRPVVAELPAEGGAPFEQGPTAVQVLGQPGGGQGVGVEGPAQRHLVTDLLRHGQGLGGVAAQGFEVPAVERHVRCPRGGVNLDVADGRRTGGLGRRSVRRQPGDTNNKRDELSPSHGRLPFVVTWCKTLHGGHLQG
jgi:hypothetical protein